MYKKLLVQEHDAVMDMAKTSDGTHIDEIKEGELWQNSFNINPNHESYGNGEANIIDFAIVDHNGRLSNTIEKILNVQLK